jgi:phosphopantothenoylcysteine decarboxylase / phosphopantothenate---cysteine ligase
MHPSRVIQGRTTRLLEGRLILVGVSGSIAAVEVPKIVRELIRHGAEVRAVMSAEATRIVTADALQFATGHPPVTQLTGDVEHVTLLGPGEGQVDLYLIAPATANTISKIAHGIDDTPVTSCASVALGGGVPMLIAPAMHAHMARNPAVEESLQKLRGWGVGIVTGAAVEGEEKLATPEEVAAAVLHRLARGPWADRRVVVIGGASREPLDAVRSITNESSGASAVAIATQAHFRGAEVALWLGAVEVPVPPFLEVTRWRTVEDLVALARRERTVLRAASAVLVPAALSDFTLEPRPGKIPSRDHPTLGITLVRAPKAVPEIRRLAPPPVRLVAFKLLAGEGEERLTSEALRLQRETGADWVVANDAATLGSATTDALVITTGEERLRIQGTKAEFAGRLLDALGGTLPTEGGSSAPRGRPGSRGPRKAHRRTARRRS